MNEIKRNNGFTLVELLLYVGIFAVMATAVTGILVTTVKVQNKEVASIEVAQQLNFVLNTIQRLVSQSSVIEETYEGTNPDAACTTFCTLKLRTPTIGGDEPNLGITKISSTASGVYIQQGSGSQTALTNSQITVDSLTFTIFSTSGGHATVQVNASLSYNSTDPQLAVTKTSQFAVGRVSAATFDSSLLPDTDNNRDVGQASPTLRWKDIYIAGLLGFGNIASDPTGLTAGSVYYNTTSPAQLKIYNGSTWSNVSPFVSGTSIAYYTGGNVGIGTSTPTSGKLEISSADTASNYVGLQIGQNDPDNWSLQTSGTYGANFTSSTTSAGISILRVANGSAEIFRVDGNGSIGIGTTTPSSAAKLQVAGQYASVKYTTTTTLDWANGNVQYIQLANGGQTFTFANPLDGGRYILILKQPASGAAGTVTWPSTVAWPAETAPTLTTTNSKVDITTFVYDATNTKYYSASTLNF